MVVSVLALNHLWWAEECICLCGYKTTTCLLRSGGSDASDCFSEPHGVPPGVLGSEYRYSISCISWSLGSGFPLIPG